MNETELLWYRFVILFISLFIIIVTIISATYFNKFRLEGSTLISNSAATNMTWLNIIIAILAMILLFWSLFRLIFPDAHHAIDGNLSPENINKIYNYKITENTQTS